MDTHEDKTRNSPQVRIHVIMAIHNRRDLTLRAVSACKLAGAQAQVEIEFFVFDDGSTDGSGEELESLPDTVVHLQRGDGSAFWARSMAAAEANALKGPEAQYLLWLNDDVCLYPTAIQDLLQQAGPSTSSITVGATDDVTFARLSYSGYVRKSSWNPLRLTMVEGLSGDRKLDAIHGNCVLVPREVAVRMGGIDGAFSHGWADIDYGLRARRQNIGITLCARTVGMCAANRVQLHGSSVLGEWKSYLGTKGAGNFHSLRRILRRHAGARWPILVLSSYLLWWARAVPRELKRTLGRA